MKIKVKDLHPNPFRRMDRYPIDRLKVDTLKASIEETTFWDNLVARKHNGQIQIAYGHHRLTALQELKVKEVDIPIKELDDGMMIKIMANENLDEWKTNPAVINETVLVAKEYLDGEFGKYTFETLPSDLIKLLDQKTEKAFNKTKAGVGQTTLLKFLGGTWKQWVIQEALATLRAEAANELDRTAAEMFPTLRLTKAFGQAVEHHKVPVLLQKEIADVMVDEDLTYDQIGKHMNRYSRLPSWWKFEKKLRAFMIDCTQHEESFGRLCEYKDSEDNELYRAITRDVNAVASFCLRLMVHCSGKEKVLSGFTNFIKEMETDGG
jgi:hypothetical protein